jgi:hypothetical protein
MVDDSHATCRLQGRSDATRMEDDHMSAENARAGDEDERGPTRGGRGGGAAGFALGVVFGALLGAGIALLYAPDRGDKTRRQLKRRLQRLREDAEEGLDRAGERTRKELIRRRRRMEERLGEAAERGREILE